VVIVGESDCTKGAAFRWTRAEGMVALATCPRQRPQHRVRGFGRRKVIVGLGEDGATAYRRSGGGGGRGWSGLGHLPGDENYGYAQAVSADGEVIVGVSGWEDFAGFSTRSSGIKPTGCAISMTC